MDEQRRGTFATLIKFHGINRCKIEYMVVIIDQKKYIYI
jgi:hypothetical protein